MAVLPSPLSSSINGINQSTVSGNVFGSDKQDPETKSKLQSLTSSILALQNQVNELSKNNITNIGVFSSFQQSFSNQISSVKSQLDKINDTLESVSTTISSESIIERQKDLISQENEKRLAESGARGGQESLLETKIQSALSEPLSRIGNTVSFGFQNLMSFITTLLGGWLTLEGIKTIKAYQDDDKTKLNDIKDSVLKTLGIAGGIFLIINVGITKVIGSITGLIGKIGKFLIGGLIIKPFTQVMQGLGGSSRTPTPPKRPKPKEGGFLPGIGKIITGASGVMNFLNGENIDAALAALTFVPGGGIFKLARVAAGTVFTIDEIAEALGKNFTGADPKLLKQKQKELEEIKKKNENKITSSPLKKPEAPKPADAKPVPSTPMTPPASNLQIKTPEAPPKGDKPSSTPAPAATSSPAPAAAPTTSQPSITPEAATSSPAPAATSSPAPPDASKVKQYEMAWQYRNNPMARGKIEGAWNKMNNEEKQQAITWATAKGYDWKEMKLPDIKPSAQITGSTAETPSITPAEVSKVPTVPFNIGPEPELKPNVVYTSSGSSTPQQQPLKSGPASDVPFISSSNPDNFYALYSQINYNVIT